MAVSLLPGTAAVPSNGAPYSPHFAWSLQAPRRVCEAEDVRASGKGWRAWAEHLRERTRPGKLSKLWKGRTSPLMWGWRSGDLTAETAALLVRLHDFSRKKGRLAGHVEGELRSWLDGVRGASATPALALEATAWTMVLPRLASTSAPTLWWSGWEYLIHLALTYGEPGDSDPLATQLLGGELAMALAFQFPELAVSGQLAEQARQTLDEGCRLLLDSQGMCAARDIHHARALLACWTRAYSLGLGIDRKFWAPTVAKRLHGAMKQLLHWTRRDGRSLFADESGSRMEPMFVERLSDQFGSRSTAAVLKQWLPNYRAEPSKNDKPKTTGKLPDAATHSEWGQCSLLRSDWSRAATSLAVLWNEPTLQVELSIGNELLALGAWKTEIRRDGELLRPQAPWEEVCWLSDDDGVYLEVEQPLSPGAILQRQLFLAREDRFLLMADAVISETPARWEYAATLPLLPQVAFEPAAETTEGAIHTRNGAFRVFPLALPEWRIASRDAQLAQSSDGLTLRQTQSGHGFFAPLWIDLDPRRQSVPYTWRQITVAQDREIMSRDRAVGFRVQVGKKQWIIYRSLGEKGNRTLLGHNLITDYLVAQFLKNGEIEPLVEIE